MPPAFVATLLALSIAAPPAVTSPASTMDPSATAQQSSTVRSAIRSVVRYTVRFPDPASHYAEIAAELPTAGRATIEIWMPVWTPGSYLVREYARNVEGLTAAADGAPLAVVKTSKNRWRITTGGAAEVQLRYRLYCRDLSVRASFVTSRFALLNGAATFFALDRPTDHAYEVGIELPAPWGRALTALPQVGESWRFLARDFDELVDAPLFAGSPAVYPLAVDGPPHWLINEGEGGSWDGPRSAADLATLFTTAGQLWGSFPYPRFLVFNLLTEAGGGLEHRDSTVLMSSRLKTRRREDYLDWLSLAAHELFHAWNGKRLRPRELGPFDYEQEVYSHSLWAVEGITSYYDDLLVRRAGLATTKEYLKALSKSIEKLQTTPGRQVQALELASFDAWIKFYRSDENSPNASISYYTKGAVVAWLLDVEVRRATGGQRSLDDVLRLAFARHAGEQGYDPSELEAAASEVAGVDLKAFFARALRSTEELDYGPALAWFGLRFAATDEPKPDEPEEPAGWLGVGTEKRAGSLWVNEIQRGTPAAAAGLEVDDELLALDGYRVAADDWEARLKATRPGQQAELLVARRQQLLRLRVVLGSEPKPAWKLTLDPTATAEQRAHLTAWLGGV